MIKFLLFPSEDFKESSTFKDFLHILAILSFLFLLFYFLVLVFSPQIHHQELIDINSLTPWVRPWISQNEGRELPVMFIGSFIYLVFAYFLVLVFSPQIHHQELIDINSLTPWVRPWISQNEGRELPVMFIGSFIYLVFAFWSYWFLSLPIPEITVFIWGLL